MVLADGYLLATLVDAECRDARTRLAMRALSTALRAHLPPTGLRLRDAHRIAVAAHAWRAWRAARAPRRPCRTIQTWRGPRRRLHAQDEPILCFT